MTAPGKVMLDEAELTRLANTIKSLLEQAREYAGGLVDQWWAVVNEWIGRAREILGDRPKLQAAIVEWQKAGTEVTGVETELGYATSRNSFWAGAGADGFETWVMQQHSHLERWKVTFGSNGASSGLFVSALGKASAQVGTFLVGLAEAFALLVTGITDALGTAGGVISVPVAPAPVVTVNPGAISMAVATAANSFVKAANAVLAAAVAAINTADASGNDIGGAAGTLTEFQLPAGLLDHQESHPVP